MSIRDPEQLRADIGRWAREIRTWRATGLTDDHPNIKRRLNRIALAQHLLDKREDAVRPCARTERHTPHPHGVILWCQGRDSLADAAGRLPGCLCGLTGPPLPDGSALADPDPECPHHGETA